MTKTAIVISSCDAFEDCWQPLLSSLEQYWSDCPWDIYMISNYKEITDPKVNFIKVGKDLNWASNLKKAISTIEVDWIIYLQEDFWLTNKVDSELLEQHIKYCIANKVDYLRLTFPFFDKFAVDDTAYSQIPEGVRYRLCLQAAIWNKNALNHCLIDGWTGWDFEYNLEKYLTQNDIKIKSLVITSKDMPLKGIEYVGGTAVRKGRWTISATKYLKEHNFTGLLPQRKVEGIVLTRLMQVNTPFVRLFAKVAVRILMKLKINV